MAIITMNSCSVANRQRTNVPVEKINLNVPASGTDKIFFLTFRITSTDTAKDLFDIKLINSIFGNGSLKKNDFFEKTAIEPNYLYYQLQAEDSKANDKKYERIENPLMRDYEYLSEDGKFGRKTIIRNSGELVIRFQYDPNLKSILIFKPDRHSLTLKPIYHGTF